MRHLPKALWFFSLLGGFFLTNPTTEARPTKTRSHRTQKTTRYTKKTTHRKIVFDKIDIQGRRHLPNALYVLSREKFSYKIPLRGKKNFSNKVISAVKKAPF